MTWLAILAAGLFETGFAVSLKLSDGMTRLWPTVSFAMCALMSFALLTIALRKLEVGAAYAVWTGIGAAGTALVGMIFARRGAGDQQPDARIGTTRGRDPQRDDQGLAGQHREDGVQGGDHDGDDIGEHGGDLQAGEQGHRGLRPGGLTAGCAPPGPGRAARRSAGSTGFRG